MSGAERRLRTDKDFRTLFRHGEVVRGRLLSLRRAPNKLHHNRFGFIISTRTAKSAVDRNRIKRRLRAIMSKTAQPVDVGMDIAITALPTSLGASFQQLNEEISRLLHAHAPPRRQHH